MPSRWCFPLAKMRGMTWHPPLTHIWRVNKSKRIIFRHGRERFPMRSSLQLSHPVLFTLQYQRTHKNSIRTGLVVLHPRSSIYHVGMINSQDPSVPKWMAVVPSHDQPRPSHCGGMWTRSPLLETVEHCMWCSWSVPGCVDISDHFSTELNLRHVRVHHSLG